MANPLHWLERREVVAGRLRDKLVTVDIWIDYAQLDDQARKAFGSKSQKSRDGAVVVEVAGWKDRED